MTTFKAYGTKNLPMFETVSYTHAAQFADEQDGWVENIEGQVVYGRKPVATIDLTPTWAGVLPLLLEAYANGTEKGRSLALIELRNMAKLADKYKDGK